MSYLSGPKLMFLLSVYFPKTEGGGDDDSGTLFFGELDKETET